MTALIVLAIVVLLVVVSIQIGKISELSANIRGEEASERDSNRFNASLGMIFLVAFLALCVGSAWYYKDFMIGYGALPRASVHGESIQEIFNITLFFTGIIFVLTHIALFWFAYKYSAQKGRASLFIPENHTLEKWWTGIPAVVMCGLVIFGLAAWNEATADVTPGEDFVEIEATAHQFAWELRYPGKDKVLGEKYFKNIVPGVNDLGINFNDPSSYDDIYLSSSDMIVLPKGRKVRVRITAQDVLHNFALAHFSVKMDAIPGLPTYFVFTPTMTTEEYRQNLKKYKDYNVPYDPADPTGPKKWESFNFELSCQELCGRGHFSMRRIVKIVSPEEYETWLATKTPFFPENIEAKVKAGQYTWYKGSGELTTAKPTVPTEFSAVALETAKVGDVLNLKHVNFATGSAVLTPESAQELGLIVVAMSKNATMTVEVSGHTDNAGNSAKNQSLSEARAKAVADFIAQKNIEAKRMTAVGFGDTKPLADNTTAEGKQQNRRTEFKIITK
jgi:cytochrome c oxidase subunit II